MNMWQSHSEPLPVLHSRHCCHVAWQQQQRQQQQQLDDDNVLLLQQQHCLTKSLNDTYFAATLAEAATGTTSKRDAMTDSSHMHVVCVIDLVRGKDSKNKDGGMESPVAALKVAYAEIEKACECVKVELTYIPFEKLDFGETDVLDKFYNADVAIVDMSVHVQQSALVYHIGVRESMGMPQTIITLHDTDPEFTLSVKLSCGNTDFVPYVIDTEGHCVIVDMPGALMSSDGLAIVDKTMPLFNKLRRILKEVEMSNRTHVKEKFLSDLRKAREHNTGPALAKILSTMRNRMDDPQLLAPDVILNMLISYRDVQDYNAMVSLVEDVENVPNNKITNNVAIMYQYSFALNRRNKKGDRDKALSVIQKSDLTNFMWENPLSASVEEVGRVRIRSTSPSILGHCVPNDRLISSHDSFFTCVEKTLELGPLWFHFGHIRRRG
ncbi:Mitogen-activated protein kinase kinase kinase 15 [Lamellibrachia satsuma]|nr:Mitogen-activated protein kinase kinase kinase 15 [Lamellibrachia satsuma]